MKKKLLLLYWTGTFNTAYIANLIGESFKDEFEVTYLEVTYKVPLHNDFSSYDLIGVGYPIYGFNVPGYFQKFVKKQKYKKDAKVFIFKDSGETLMANNASSVSLYRFFKRKGITISNEYHFVMPYNIHFRYEDDVVNEMLLMNDKLVKILHHDISRNIPNIQRYTIICKLITFFVGIIHIGGFVNSFFYKVDKKKCSKCGLCIKGYPMDNIYFSKKGKIKFHHRCEMCMRCSFFCLKDAISIGYINGWRVNGKYDLAKIKAMSVKLPVVSLESRKHFHCLLKTYKDINEKYEKLG